MNNLGATLLIFSGALVFICFLFSLLSLSLRSSYQFSRLLSLELLNLSYRKKWSRFFLSYFCFLQNALAKFFRITSPKQALDIARKVLYANCFVIGFALILLVLLMLSDDLSNRYVVNHSSLFLASFYKITGVWAGSSGSLLFWYFLLTLFCSICVYQSSKKKTISKNQNLILILIFISTHFIFVGLNLFFREAQPFRIYAVEMQAGRGLNPLLLHWAMIIHPPLLYLGYVSSVVPFGILLSALLTGKSHQLNFSFLRNWVLFSWFFLGIGILLGSKWAYEELGWGGYWAWDPVENASLMPWLVLTAFLHSLIVQENRGSLRFWNICLIAIAYYMCLIGTWITRSGVLEGPHTFAQSNIGTPMIIFIFLSALYYLRFIYFLRHRLRPKQAITTLTSKEGSMLLNNFVMLLSMFIILIGVFSPLLPLDCVWENGGLECYKVEWKQSAYNALLVPLGIFTLFLMGASPLLSWKKSAIHIWRKKLKRPLLWGIIAGLIFAFTNKYIFTQDQISESQTWGLSLVSKVMAILTLAVSVFVIVGIIEEYRTAINFRKKRYKEKLGKAFRHTLFQNKIRYGGYLVHLAIVFLCIGYSGSAFKKTAKLEFEYRLMPWYPNSKVVHYYSGDKAYLGKYEIQARSLYFRPIQFNETKNLEISQEAHYQVQIGTQKRNFQRPLRGKEAYLKDNAKKTPIARFLQFTSGAVLDGKLRTERHFYPQINPVSGKVLRTPQKHAIFTPTSEPSILSRWDEDLYIQLGALHNPQQKEQTPFNHFYEAYYKLFKKDKRAYEELFPSSIIATLEVWINPLVKFIWLGSLLFFFAGFLLLLPIGTSSKS